MRPIPPSPSGRKPGRARLPARRRRQAVPVGERRRLGALFALVAIAFLVEAGQLARLAGSAPPGPRSAQVEAVARSVTRPDILDRQGRLLASDVQMASLFADPGRIIDADEAAERLAAVLPELDEPGLRDDLADKSKRFIWLRRGLSPSEEKAVHELGIPGLGFRYEPRRVYPAAANAGHVLGYVDVENRGATGIERYIDQLGAVRAEEAPGGGAAVPVVMSIDLAIQHALRSELQAGLAAYQADAAAGLVLDVETGEVLADVSLPDFPAGRAAESLAPERLDRIAGGTFELGSVLKTLTLAMAERAGVLTPGQLFDATAPIKAGRDLIDDFHPTRRMLTAEEVFLHSSNIGAARMGLAIGDKRLRAFLDEYGLTTRLRTEQGPVAPPQLPERWDDVTTMTVSFGHGIALAPLQFAAAAAMLVNGGRRIEPTFLRRPAGPLPAPVAAVPPETALVRKLLRANVVDPQGTGRRAAVAGYEVGGKTGTADIPGPGGYGRMGVLTSFLAILPAHQPRYLTYVLLWNPKATPAANGQTAAGANAAPLTGALLGRIAPLLGLPSEAGSG